MSLFGIQSEDVAHVNLDFSTKSKLKSALSFHSCVNLFKLLNLSDPTSPAIKRKELHPPLVVLFKLVTLDI